MSFTRSLETSDKECGTWICRENTGFGKFTKPLITFITLPSIPFSQAMSAQRGMPSYTYFAYTAGKEDKLRAPCLQLIWICLTQETCSPIYLDTVRQLPITDRKFGHIGQL